MIIMDERTTFRELLSYGRTNRDTVFTPASLTRVIRKYIGSPDITVTTTKSVDVDLDQVVIGGQYDPYEDQANFSSITIFITYNPEQKEFSLKDIGWKQVCVNLIECLGHELIHQQQYRNREFDIANTLFVSSCTDDKRRDEQEYLGNPDEIEAYGYSVASELFLKYKLAEITKNHVKKSQMFKVYASTFGIDHPVVQELTEHIVRYYLQLNDGSFSAIRIRQ